MSSININKDFLSDVYDYIKGDVLFEGVTNQDVILDKSAKDYSTLKIYFNKGNTYPDACTFMKLKDGIGSCTYTFTWKNVSGDYLFQIQTGEMYANDKNFGINTKGYANLQAGGSMQQGIPSRSEIYLTKVIGYKY